MNLICIVLDYVAVSIVVFVLAVSLAVQFVAIQFTHAVQFVCERLLGIAHGIRDDINYRKCA